MSGGPAGDASNAVNSMSMLSSFLPFVLVFLVMYFLVIRPQKVKQKEHEKMLSELKKGDKVVTQGGLLGTVCEIKDEVVVVRVGESSRLDVLRGHIIEVRK